MNDTSTPDGDAARRARLDGLVVACAGKDRAAFSELFAFFAPRIKAYLRRLASDDATAEELTQEVMITVWRKAAQFDARQASASTWIYRIARNRRIDLARKDGKPPLDADEPMLQPPGVEAPDDAMFARDRETRVRAALTLLPGEQMTLLRRAFFDGLSHSQIAESEGLPLGTVKSRLRLAFDKLREALDRDDI
ncbi:MAG: RNA polymerase subunit sigma [Maricaulis sp.]|nr:RNA polymerase subunit sigma [Maricaulis sp.]